MALVLCDSEGRRASMGGDPKLQTDPNFRNNLQFYEYFNGDNGQGLGANHQTGWTGLIANLISEHGKPGSPIPQSKTTT